MMQRVVAALTRNQVEWSIPVESHGPRYRVPDVLLAGDRLVLPEDCCRGVILRVEAPWLRPRFFTVGLHPCPSIQLPIMARIACPACGVEESAHAIEVPESDRRDMHVIRHCAECAHSWKQGESW